MDQSRTPFRRRRSQPGFTLVELIIVIVITGIVAGMLAVFFKPAVDAYFGSRRRAEMTDMADTALRRMARDIRFAVPNSIRLPNQYCFEAVPASAGGRYRLAPDTGWDTANPGDPSAPIDGTTAVSAFDVLSLSPLTAPPTNGDFVVIDNQYTDDVYNGTNRTTVQSYAAVTANPQAQTRSGRLTLSGPFSFPAGYFEGRFMIVPQSQEAVFYFCDFPGGVKEDTRGNGTGTLYRAVVNFSTSAAACPAAASQPIVATSVSECIFSYSPSNGGTQNGFMWMQVQLKQLGETVSLSYGTHVDNIP